jgi:cholesterol oxidase
LTIAAVAERACAILAEQYGWQFDSSLASSKPHEKGRIAIIASDLKLRRQRARMALEQNVDGYGKFLWQQFSKVAPHSAKIAREALSFRLQFEERMSGYFNEIETTPERSKLETERRIANPFDLVHRIGQVRKNDMVGSFKVRIPDLKEFELATDHSGELSGTVTCLSLSKHPMKLTEGLFELLRSDSDRVETWEMNYRGILEVQGGPNLNFDAFKLLDEKSGSHWWTDVTTLFVEISRQHVATDGRDQAADQTQLIIGRGILKLSLDDLIRQITTIELQPRSDETTNVVEYLEIYTPPLRKRLELLNAMKLVKVFALSIFNAYGGLLSNLKNFASEDNARFKQDERQLNCRLLQSYPAIAGETATPGNISNSTGGKFALKRYGYDQPGKRGPVILAPGFGVTASSFATNTVEENLVEYLCKNDYDVWLFDYRAGPHSGWATEPFSIDDVANEDWPQCIDFVRKETGADSVQVVAHCVGSMTLLISIMNGLEGVRSAVCSQLTLHPVTDWLNYLKADIGVGEILAATGTHKIDIRSDDSDEAKGIDAMLYRMPVPPGEECNNPVCHRIFSIFGPSYTHSQLNNRTHAALEDMFGEISTSAFEQLAEIIRQGKVVDSKGRDVYQSNVEKLKMPLSFIAGQKIQIFFTETSLRTYQWLRAHNERNGEKYYDRKVIAGYAHMDLFIGRSANEEGGPYQYILEQLRKPTPI